MKRVAVDAFGGDNSPGAILAGCARALAEKSDLFLIVTGDESAVKAGLLEHGADMTRVEVRHAPGVITNHEHPVAAVKKKKDSSIVAGLQAVADGDADAFVSAGSTGAVLAGATLIVKRIKGVKRPALSPVLPTAKEHGVVLVDCGANVDCKPHYLQQFAIMGAAYAEHILGIKNPRVGLLNNGAEEGKGCELTKEAYELLKGAPVNFTGNCEGRDIVGGDFDVVVADGFAGNVALKSIEGAAGMVTKVLKKEMLSGFMTKLGAVFAKRAFANLKSKMDYRQYGGAPLLGIDGGIIKAHGTSDEFAFAKALHQACALIEGGVVDIIRDKVQSTPVAE